MSTKNPAPRSTRTFFPAAAPEASGFASERLERIGTWLRQRAEGRPYRVRVLRHERTVAEWAQGIPADEPVFMSSGRKSIYSCMLGIAVEEGVIASVDDRVVDYYPEMMDVGPERGPKSGRYAFPENREITFRQLIGNTSGYMKPGELPGRQFHYQTYGMNVLIHTIAAAYGRYDTQDPEGSLGFGSLVEEKLRDPIGADWSSHTSHFDFPPNALAGVFGYSTHFMLRADDYARLGALWLNDGAWNGKQIVPSAWMAEATRTSRMVLEHEAPENHRYGLGFWTNDRGALRPDLPRESFAAWGGQGSTGLGVGHTHIWACRSLDLVVTQTPGFIEGPAAGDELSLIVDALEDR